MNVLSIGNSFSEDAQRYLHRIARSENCSLDTVNLYIGGCSLKQHYNNLAENNRNYEIQCNGEKTGFFTTISEALKSREWDYITLQQVSHEAVNIDTYEPYLSGVSEYIKNVCPNTKLILHQTWAYEDGSDRLIMELGYKNHKEMLNDIIISSDNASRIIGSKDIIRSGELLDLLLREGIKRVHRDTFHASFGIGRYALGLLWYGYLTGNDTSNVSFIDTDEKIEVEDIQTAKKCVKKILEINL